MIEYLSDLAVSNGSITYCQQFVGNLAKDQMLVVGVHSIFGLGQMKRANDDDTDHPSDLLDLDCTT